jgi:hypothetical protein
MRSASAVRSVVPTSGSETLPNTFKQALSTGWVIVSEDTALSSDQKARRGKVILGLKGQSYRLSVSYTATTTGFEFSVPRLIR